MQLNRTFLPTLASCPCACSWRPSPQGLTTLMSSLHLSQLLTSALHSGFNEPMLFALQLPCQCPSCFATWMVFLGHPCSFGNASCTPPYSNSFHLAINTSTQPPRRPLSLSFGRFTVTAVGRARLSHKPLLVKRVLPQRKYMNIHIGGIHSQANQLMHSTKIGPCLTASK